MSISDSHLLQVLLVLYYGTITTSKCFASSLVIEQVGEGINPLILDASFQDP